MVRFNVDPEKQVGWHQEVYRINLILGTAQNKVYYGYADDYVASHPYCIDHANPPSITVKSHKDGVWKGLFRKTAFEIRDLDL